MSEPMSNKAETRGGSCAPSPGSHAIIYAGHNYGKRHTILKWERDMVTAQHEDGTIVMCHPCDVEVCEDNATNCRDCGKPIHRLANQCPRCGHFQ